VYLYIFFFSFLLCTPTHPLPPFAPPLFCHNPPLFNKTPSRSTLKRLVPTVGTFWTPLKLVEAFQEYDELFNLSRRRYVPPNFAEVRHILNIAQVREGWRAESI
jgi:hypothetical protein